MCRSRPGGRRSDPRMDRAVELRLVDDKLSPQEALFNAGFTFDFKDEGGEPMDAENITLTQRRNNLSRRIRLAKKAKDERKFKVPAPFELFVHQGLWHGTREI